MYYEINVSFNKHHLFATAPRSIDHERKLVELLKLFKEKFPQSEGYEISATEHPGDFHSVDIDELLNPTPEENYDPVIPD